MAPGNQLPAYVLQQARFLIDETDMSLPAIAGEIGIRRETVWKRARCLRLFNEPYAPATVRLGRPLLLNQAQKDVSYYRCNTALLIND